MNWELIPFEKLFSVVSRNGLTKPSRVRGSGFKMINMGELFANDRIYDIPMEFVPLNDKEKISAKVEKDDLLFARQSLVLEGAGKCSIVMDVSPLTVFESHIIRVRLNQELANPLFYYYYFRSPYSPIKTIVSQCAQAGIRGSDLQKLEVVFPPIETQGHIADVLSAYDNLIENNQKQIKLLEEAAQRMYKEWFIDLRFPGHENTPIVDGVPDGWSYRPLSDLFSFIRGKSYTSKELSETNGVLMINLKNIRAFGGYNRNAEKRFTGKYKEEQALSPGDLIMAVTDMTQERRLVGHAAIVPDLGEPMTLSMDLIKLVPLNIHKSYLYSSLYYGGYSFKISPLANGVNVLHLKPEAMMNLQMLVPTGELMDAFGKVFDPIQSRIELLQNQIDVAAESRDRLLPKLMSGEIEV